MPSVQDDVVVEALPSDRANESLYVRILPGALWCGENLLHAQGLDSQSNLSTVPAVPIAEEVTGSVSVCERLEDLLRGPGRSWMLSHIKMQHLATIVFQDNKHEQYRQRDSRHGKEIGGYYFADMVVQDTLRSNWTNRNTNRKRLPCLDSFLPSSSPSTGYGRTEYWRNTLDTTCD